MTTRLAHIAIVPFALALILAGDSLAVRLHARKTTGPVPPEEILNVPDLQFTNPRQTFFPMSVEDGKLEHDLPAEVWIKYRTDSSGAKELRPVYSSSSDSTIVAFALTIARGLTLLTPARANFDAKWYYHRVVLMPPGKETNLDPNSIPVPDVFPALKNPEWTESKAYRHPVSRSPRLLPSIPEELVHLAKGQFTLPAESVVRPMKNEDNNLGLMTAEVWFKVRFGADGTKELHPIFWFPNDSDFVLMAKDSLTQVSLRAPGDSAHKDSWSYHRVLLLAADDEQPPVDTALPVPLDTAALNLFGWIDPEMIHMGEPTYPPVAKSAGLTGRVWVKARVAKDGSVLAVKVATSSGVPLLDQAAAVAGYKSRYEPALKDGVPITTWVTYKVEFFLNE